MATPKALNALEKTKEALAGIKTKLQPVLSRLQDETLDDGTKAHANATIALSIGMMRYMGARLRGLDQGRNADDPLRKELNNMRRVLAEIKKKNESKKGCAEVDKKRTTQEKEDKKQTATSSENINDQGESGSKEERANPSADNIPPQATADNEPSGPDESTTPTSKSGGSANKKRKSPGNARNSKKRRSK
jgi:hypothetical protein